MINLIYDLELVKIYHYFKSLEPKLAKIFAAQCVSRKLEINSQQLNRKTCSSNSHKLQGKYSLSTGTKIFK